MQKFFLYLFLMFLHAQLFANIVRIGPHPNQIGIDEIFQDVVSTDSTITRLDCSLAQQIVQTANVPTTPFLTANPPFRILNPGQYCVTTEISVPPFANGIVIETDDVILDLDSRVIIGQNGSLHGILITGVNRRNITIANGSIFNMGGNGIQMNNGGEQIIFQDLKMSRNNIGISVAGIRNFIFRDCLLFFNRSNGLILSQFGAILNQNGLVQNVISSFNQLNGILSTGSSNIRFNTIDTSNNTGSGINEINGSRLSFESVQSNNNNLHGIFSSGLGNFFINCITNSNNGIGTWLTGNRITFSDCQAKANNLDGFRISGNNCDITNAAAIANNQIGFNILGNGQSYEQCNANQNNIGFQIANANNCILNNLAKLNTTFGFLMQPSSTQCQIRNNTASANGTSGFQNNTLTVNYIYSNFSSNNGVGGIVNFVGITNFVVSPIPAAAINFTTNISN